MSTPEKQPENNEASSFQFKDVFGFGQIVDKLPLQKLNAKMSYCIVASIILLGFFGFMYMHKTKENSFPTAGDMRGVIVVVVILLFLGFFNEFIKKDSSKKK